LYGIHDKKNLNGDLDAKLASCIPGLKPKTTDTEPPLYNEIILIYTLGHSKLKLTEH
jgi:hypothetical protein